MPRLRSAATLFLLILCTAWLGGCDSSSTGPSGPAGTGTELSAGSYFIQYDSDDLYRFEQYFVVQPGYHWEFVEYGYEPDTKILCQLTRHKGVYSTTDSSLTMTIVAAGSSAEKCGMTKTDFNAVPFEAAPANTKGTFQIRNVTSTSFEGMDLFDGITPGWHTYTKKTDPYGFY